jgi:hypothetical protein
MEFSKFAIARLAFLTLWATVCGPLSGFTMGLFFLVYQDGYRKGILPPQGNRALTELMPNLSVVTSRFGGGQAS